MNAMLQTPIKLLTGLFNEKTRASKALSRARERQQTTQREVNECAVAIEVATVIDPVLHVARRPVTKEQLTKWKQEHQVATAELEAATAEVAQAETALNALETDLDSQMTLATVKASYREAVAERETWTREVAAVREKLQRGERELSERRSELTGLTAQAVESHNEDYRGAMSAITQKRDEVATAELMLQALRHKEQQAIEASASATETVKEWERRLWKQIAEEQFTPAELAAFGERILTAYAAAVASGESGPLYSHLITLFAMSKQDNRKIAAVRSAIAKEHGIAAR